MKLRTRSVLITLEMAIFLVPSTLVYLWLFVIFMPDFFRSFGSEAALFTYAGGCLIVAWYASLLFVDRGQSGIRGIPVSVVMAGSGGLVWVVLAMVSSRTGIVNMDDVGIAMFFLVGGGFGIPTALLGTHLLIEWIVAYNKPPQQSHR